MGVALPPVKLAITEIKKFNFFTLLIKKILGDVMINIKYLLAYFFCFPLRIAIDNYLFIKGNWKDFNCID